MTAISYHNSMNEPDGFTDEAPAMDNRDNDSSIKKPGDLPGFLRGVGALIVIAGMCSYLMEGWDAWNGVSRYFVMVGGSALLAAAGLAMSYMLRENNGARAFLALALISVLTCITTLGGFIYSAVGPVVESASQSGVLGMDWSIPDGVWLTAMIGTAFVVLAPITLFAYKILNRPHAIELLTTLAIGGGLLLIPVRESLAIGILILFAVAIPLVYLHRVARENAHFKTFEGRFTAITLFAPAIIMLARLLWLYEADALIGWILCAIGFGSLRYAAATLKLQSISKMLNDLASGFLAICIGSLSCILVEPYFAEAVITPFGTTIFAALVIFMGYQRPEARHSYRNMALLVLVFITAINFIAFDTTLAMMVSLLIGVGILLWGYVEQCKTTALLGMVLLGVAVMPTIVEFIGTVDLTNWLTLAVLGVTTIVVGSLVERANRKQS